LRNAACLNDAEIFGDASASSDMDICYVSIYETDKKGEQKIGAEFPIGLRDPKAPFNIKNLGLKLKANTYYKITIKVSSLHCNNESVVSKVIFISSQPQGKRVTKYFCCESSSPINLGELVGRGPEMVATGDNTVSFSAVGTLTTAPAVTGMSNYTAVATTIPATVATNTNYTATTTNAHSGITGILGSSNLGPAPYPGGTVTYTAEYYEWVSSDGTYKSREKAPVISPKKAYERYYCTFTNQYGCKSVDTYYVENKDFDLKEENCFCSSKKLSINLERATSDDCFNFKAQVETPISYKWSTGETTSSINVNPNSRSTYSVTMTTPCGQQYGKKVKSITIEPPYSPTGGIPNITLSNNIVISSGNFTLALEKDKGIGIAPAYNATKYRLEVMNILSQSPIYSKTIEAKCGGFANGDVKWNGTNTNGSPVAAATYIYSLYFTNCDGIERKYSITQTYKNFWGKTKTRVVEAFSVVLIR
jgi:hypothetical protein